MIDTQLVITYPKAATAITIVEGMTSSDFVTFDKIVGEITGSTIMTSLQVMARDEGLAQTINYLYHFSQRVGLNRNTCEQFLTDDFKLYLAGKLGMM